MDLFQTPFISTGRIKGSFEIFTYLAKMGDQNSFICPFLRSLFVDHLVNVRHYPPGVVILRGKQRRELVILMPEWGITERHQGTVEGHPPLSWGALFFLLPASVLGLLTSALHPNHDALVTVGPRFSGDLCVTCRHLPKPDGAFNKSCEHLIGLFLSNLKRRFPERTGKNN